MADLIKVDKKYETAVEIALGGSIQNIVTADEERLQKNDWLSEAEPVWTCNFPSIDSDSVGDRDLPGQKPFASQGVIGTADKLVTVEDKFTSLAEHLLGRTLVADNIDTGIRLARKYRQSCVSLRWKEI